ncbi:Lcl domain-containing protein, partial [Candidatus Venteria ishoeyi]|uniref:Lcl domain-containing protein n=1 Tax=Candidatus Venteria ishoeyi TaxID=1899563 RepID=UPI000CDF089A
MKNIYFCIQISLYLFSLVWVNHSQAQTCPDSIQATTPDQELTLNTDNTVTHHRTALIWDRCPWGQSGAECGTGTAGEYDWQQALEIVATANAQKHLGHNDWRLPNKNELASLVERHCYNPAINGSFFPNTPASGFWSSSPYAANSHYAWYVYFGNGFVGANGEDDTLRVRLVRGGQAFDFLPAPNQSPSAQFSLSPASGQAPLSVTLNGATSSDPDGDNLTYAWDASGVAFGNGAVSFQHEFAAGDYSITLTVTDPAGLSHQSSQSLSVTAALEPEPLPVSSGLGKAIIITASGAHTNNSLFARSEELTRRMYRALYQRGFEHEDIIWLNPKKWQDIDGDGRDDGVVDDELFDPAQALANAFETMSSLQAGQQFVLHIHGHV